MKEINYFDKFKYIYIDDYKKIMELLNINPITKYEKEKQDMKINDLIKGNLAERMIYDLKIEIPSMGFEFKKYIPIEEKLGLARKIVKTLYDEEKNVFDSVNLIMFLPVFFAEKYCDNLEFPNNMEDLDITGIYDYLKSSGAISEINNLLSDEISELNNIVNSLVVLKYRLADSKNPLEDFLSSVSNKTPEDIENMTMQIDELMENDNIKDMISFKNKDSGE